MIPFTFSALLSEYKTFPPLGFRETGRYYKDTCAVRLADAITRIHPDFFRGTDAEKWTDRRSTGRYVANPGGVNLKFQEAPPNRSLPIRAGQLAEILNQRIARGQVVLTAAEINAKQGIVFFEGIPGYNGSGHITLWDYRGPADGGQHWNARRVVFWQL
jgi:hypothetical protein